MLFYDEEKIGAIKPYPHVAETLWALRDRGLKLGVVTNAHNSNALKRLRKAGLEEEGWALGFVNRNDIGALHLYRIRGYSGKFPLQKNYRSLCNTVLYQIMDVRKNARQI